MQKLFIILLLISLQTHATNYYFSNTNSNDNNAGTIVAPWATWSKVNSTLQKANTGDTLFFNRGSTWYGNIATTPSSGVTFAAYGKGARPVITGLTAITSWKETTPGSHVWEASCNSGNNLDLVIIRGLTVPAGRTPNAGTYFTIDNYTKLSGGTGTITSAAIDAVKQNWTGAEAVIRVNEYNLDRDLITEHRNNTITYASPSNPKSIDGSGHKFFIQKHPATLDIQNEWYYNPSTHKLIIYSVTDPSSLQVQAATVDNFYNVNYRNHISFIGIKIKGMDSMVITGRMPVKYIIDNCEFEDIGVDAISLDTDSSATIKNCIFNRIGNTAIAARYSTHISIINNNIDSCGLMKGMVLPNNQQANGIMVEVYNKLGLLGDSTVIKNNSVTNVGYCGIRWTGTNALIQYNFVDGYGFTLADAGGIYTNGDYGLKNKRLVTDNIVQNGHGNHDMYQVTGDRGMPGIYLDDNTGQVSINNNTIADATRAAIFLHNAVGIDVINNKIKAGKGEVAIGLEDDGLGIAIRNIVITGNEIYTRPGVNAIQLRSDLNDYRSMGKFYNNKYLRSTTGNLFNVIGNTTASYSISSWKSNFGWDEGSTITEVTDQSVRLEHNNIAGYKNITSPNVDANVKKVRPNHDLKIPSHNSLLLYQKASANTKTSKPGK